MSINGLKKTAGTNGLRRGAIVVGGALLCALAFGMAVAPGAQAASAGDKAVSVSKASNASAVSLATISPSVQAGLESQEVELTGSGFLGTTSVTFGGVAAEEFQVASDTDLWVAAPAHANGVVDVVVNTSHGSATLPQAYTYTAPNSQSVYFDTVVKMGAQHRQEYTCPTETPYVRNAFGREIIGFEPNDEQKGGLINNTFPHYTAGPDRYATGVYDSWFNLSTTDITLHSVLHCTNNPYDSFKVTLTPGTPIGGPLAPSSTFRKNSMDQLEPVMINNTNSYLKITDVWTTDLQNQPSNEPFVDDTMPKVGDVIVPGGRVQLNLRFMTDGPTLHIRFTDNHGDVLDTSVSGSSFASSFQPLWTCNHTIGDNLQCHPTTAHMKDSTIVQIENAG